MQSAAKPEAVVAEALAANICRPGALLPILHHVQDRLGYVPPQAVPEIARELNLSRAEVHGVISFYHHFRSKVPGRHVIQICRAEACQAMGANHLVAHARRTLNVEFHKTTGDGRYTLEPVYCLGNCACSPAMMVDGKVYGRVSPERFDSILQSVENTP